MPWTYPSQVLKALRNRFLTDPKQLTPQELIIARRIQHCSNCDRWWLARKLSGPQRCPKCYRQRYDTPNLDRLMLELAPKSLPLPEDSSLGTVAAKMMKTRIKTEV